MKTNRPEPNPKPTADDETTITPPRLTFTGKENPLPRTQGESGFLIDWLDGKATQLGLSMVGTELFRSGSHQQSA